MTDKKEIDRILNFKHSIVDLINAREEVGKMKDLLEVIDDYDLRQDLHLALGWFYTGYKKIEKESLRDILKEFLKDG